MYYMCLELNQGVCCSAIPAAVSALHCDCVHDAIKSAITVIIACVSNNSKMIKSFKTHTHTSILISLLYIYMFIL